MALPNNMDDEGPIMLLHKKGKKHCVMWDGNEKYSFKICLDDIYS